MRAGPAAVTPAALAALAALLALLAADCAAYNEDRPIYKWSPVWFNRYFRTANAIKRAPGPGEQCVTYGRRCSYWGIRLPCCEADAKCLMEHCVPLAIHSAQILARSLWRGRKGEGHQCFQGPVPLPT